MNRASRPASTNVTLRGPTTEHRNVQNTEQGREPIQGAATREDWGRWLARGVSSGALLPLRPKHPLHPRPNSANRA